MKNECFIQIRYQAVDVNIQKEAKKEAVQYWAASF